MIERVAVHLHRMGAAGARVVTFVADGARGIWKRWDWVIAQAQLDPDRGVEVLDWCQAVHHLSVAWAASRLSASQRKGRDQRRRGLLKEGKGRDVIAALEVSAKDETDDSPMWREIRSRTSPSDSGRLK